jgi:hypothetical protein
MPRTPAVSPPVTVDSLFEWLERFEPHDQVRVVKLLADRKTQAQLLAHGDALLFGLTRARPIAEVAGEVGISESNVRRSIARHRKHVEE